MAVVGGCCGVRGAMSRSECVRAVAPAKALGRLEEPAQLQWHLARLRLCLAEGPLLVGLAVAGPELDQGAVGGGGAGHVETEPGLHADDGAVGIDRPLLIGL